jgi:1-deoxy-D-xylulose-5-phosphate reductoisomerase
VRSIVLLGSTGTIGLNTLDVLRRNREGYRVAALTAYGDDEQMAAQCREWRPRYAVMAAPESAERLRERVSGLDLDTEVLAGVGALEQVATLPEVDIVLAGIVGAAGLLPSLAAARSGKRVLLANKEALVMAGALFMETVRQSGAELLPVDSEHNAIFQCLPPRSHAGVEQMGIRRLVLTASGGPFRERPWADLEKVTPEEACAHPNWVMGPKISVDSATMMNKALEVIEACCLFGTSPQQVEVVIHPQSIVHSLVEYRDGSMLAQLGRPDMRTPIAHALGWPQRLESGVASLDLAQTGNLVFDAPDMERFQCLRLGYEAAESGGTAPTVLNAANEVAVQAFLERQIRFTDIPQVIEATLSAHSAQHGVTLETVLCEDQAARVTARQCVERLGHVGSAS